MNAEKSYEGFLASLEAKKLISLDEALSTLDTMVAEKISISKTLLGLGMIDDLTLAHHFSSYLEIDEVTDLTGVTNRELATNISAQYMRLHGAVPIAIMPDGVKVAMLDPLDEKTIQTLQDFLQKPIIPCVIAQSVLSMLMDDVIPESDAIVDDAGENDTTNQLQALKSKSNFEDAPTVRAVEKIFDQAVLLNASDIHLHRQKGVFEIRFRTDGILNEQATGSLKNATAIMSRIKILAGMDIAEKRLPQDGRARIISNGREIDLRIASLPVLEGESLTIRLLNRTRVPLNLEGLGYSKNNLQRVRSLLNNPNGLVLVTGPTGSGKTTTLYAALNEKIDGTTKIISIEDPVEYDLEGVTQVSINPSIGLTFPSVLRSALRHDPDIILVGEIRDRETAEIAIQASLTGHLVLATLHTNTAAGAIHRLLDMGIDDYLITAAVRGAIAQRLVRKLSANGADAANNIIQYEGRCAVAEVLSLSANVQKLILSGADASSIEQAAHDEGMVDFLTDGRQKVRSGVTSDEEILRITMDSAVYPSSEAGA